MAVETHVHRARRSVRAEREAVDEEIEAYETFVDRLEEISTEQHPTTLEKTVGPGGTQLQGTSERDDGCRAVLQAFAETVRPHSVADVNEEESLLETVRNELTDTIALALAPTTGTSLTDDLAAGIQAEADARRTERVVLRRALERETDVLTDAIETIDEITNWITEADETPLTELGFDSLQQRHRLLEGYRERCDRVIHDRQQFLNETTSMAAEAGIRHRNLVTYCYQDFPVDYPVLATVASLTATCETCQRAVRAQLVRRG